MTAQYAFLFDSRFCTGCKACQAACKDKNHLPAGVLWRRVMEVSGGTWQQEGAAWTSSVFAYNLSIACNHCIHPKCVGICPTHALYVREDGIVVLDDTKCMGCGYCSWGCPYDAPQYDPDAGRMTKCNFCFDNLEQGLAPACVAACPLRVLDFADPTSLPSPATNEIRLWDAPSETHPFPLPAFSHTQPRLAIKQHSAMRTEEQKHLANTEEIQPRPPTGRDDIPLVIFTLLAQLAVGGVWAMSWMFSTLWSLVEYDALILRLLPTLFLSACLGAGMLASLTHLGTKRNAWRVFSNLKYSSLSKEVLYTGLFGLGLFLVFLGIVIRQNFYIPLFIAGAAGLGLVYNMAEVYRIPAAPGWNTWRTNVSFFISALLLGCAGMTPLLAYESDIAGIQVPPSRWAVIGFFVFTLLLIQLGMTRKPVTPYSYQAVRAGFLLIGAAMAVSMAFFSTSQTAMLGTLMAVWVISEEALGRWLFYRSRL
jgi:anaerobic dimethyl sulfoxide reductase subunit B (iron-sulfur subunit)